MKTKDIIKITAKAGKKLSQIASDTKSKNLIFFVRGGGCNGFKYSIEPIKEPSEYLECIQKEDFNLCICDDSLMHLWGTTIDWKKDIMGETFDFQNQNIQGRGLRPPHPLTINKTTMKENNRNKR